MNDTLQGETELVVLHVGDLCKTLTLLIDHRLHERADAAGRIPSSQSGFARAIRRHRAINNAFMLQTLIDKANAANRILYAAFLGFSNASPTIDQPTLWLKLSQSGTSGPLIDWLRMLYSGAASPGIMGTLLSLLQQRRS